MQYKSRKATKSRLPLKIGAAVSFIAVLVTCVGVVTSFAGAGNSQTNTFGINNEVSMSTLSSAIDNSTDEGVYEQTMLGDTSSRDITKGIQSIEAAEEAARVEAERQKAEEAARIAEKVNGGQVVAAPEGWLTGKASAYNVASSSTYTASGMTLSDDSVTVAVPASQWYLMGKQVEIVWQGMTVVATVTDTGGFGGYGRALDLAPGVCKAFGVDTSGPASSCNAWGVQTVQYRYL